MTHLLLIQLEGVEDIPAESIDAGVQWEVNGVEWETYPEYLDALDKLSFACDVTSMISHGQVRSWVMGRKTTPLSRFHRHALTEVLPRQTSAATLRTRRAARSRTR